LSYDSQALFSDAGYNMMLGDGYFRRMLEYYGGSYPLAVAAYNAGPGQREQVAEAPTAIRATVRSTGSTWIEKIPLPETRNYVQRVLENAVVYEAMNPNRAIAIREPIRSASFWASGTGVSGPHLMKPEGPPITPAGMAALRARYDHLLGTERPAIVEIVSWAAGNGDRSRERRLPLWPQADARD
jgi:hypothetical protein